MKLSLGNEPLAASCALEAGSNARVEGDLAQSVARDTLLYAVCRFIRRSGTLRREYVWASCRLRLENGRARRPQRRCFVAPAPLLELPCGWVAVNVSVGPAGVTVERIGLYAKQAFAQAAVERR